MYNNGIKEGHGLITWVSHANAMQFMLLCKKAKSSPTISLFCAWRDELLKLKCFSLVYKRVKKEKSGRKKERTPFLSLPPHLLFLFLFFFFFFFCFFVFCCLGHKEDEKSASSHPFTILHSRSRRSFGRKWPKKRISSSFLVYSILTIDMVMFSLAMTTITTSYRNSVSSYPPPPPLLFSSCELLRCHCFWKEKTGYAFVTAASFICRVFVQTRAFISIFDILSFLNFHFLWIHAMGCSLLVSLASLICRIIFPVILCKWPYLHQRFLYMF